ncbi:MAG: 4-hydroxythreonine-4-phosphate dehydrogenase PdxA, partial [Ghiorsea sp.]
MMKHERLFNTAPFLLTLGEPAGIGPDCVLLAYQDHPQQFADIVIVAKACWLRQRAEELALDVCVCACADDFKREQGKACLWVYDPTGDAERPVQAGKPDVLEAEAVIHCIRVAAEMSLNGQALAMITAPIEKAILKDAGFDFPGHTEFLAAIAGIEQVVMMLASSAVRVALLTTHVALADVA